ncbi:P-loop NTPase family protein [Campylobacter concisus]|jgi:cpp12|uniref:spore coat protein CotH n=1 Tax=Campylobacter concisus TaxID=199 RepID=UPI000D2FFFD6|nr:spore coat protein CotH [Campylobacter concisus]
MRIAVINSKGGVGKTPLAFSLAKDFGLNLQTNDNSVVTQIYDKAVYFNPCKISNDTIYDFGGFVASGVLSILKECDLVIIPVTPKINSVFKAAETYKQIKDYVRNVIVLVTDVVNKGDLATIIEALKGAGFKNDVEYMLLKRSAIFENAIANGMSFAELYNQNGLSRSQYKDFYSQYYKIIEYIKTKALS